MSEREGGGGRGEGEGETEMEKDLTYNGTDEVAGDLDESAASVELPGHTVTGR